MKNQFLLRMNCLGSFEDQKDSRKIVKNRNNWLSKHLFGYLSQGILNRFEMSQDSNLFLSSAKMGALDFDLKNCFRLVCYLNPKKQN